MTAQFSADGQEAAWVRENRHRCSFAVSSGAPYPVDNGQEGAAELSQPVDNLYNVGEYLIRNIKYSMGMLLETEVSPLSLWRHVRAFLRPGFANAMFRAAH